MSSGLASSVLQLPPREADSWERAHLDLIHSELVGVIGGIYTPLSSTPPASVEQAQRIAEAEASSEGRIVNYPREQARLAHYCSEVMHRMLHHIAAYADDLKQVEAIMELASDVLAEAVVTIDETDVPQECLQLQAACATGYLFAANLAAFAPAARCMPDHMPATITDLIKGLGVDPRFPEHDRVPLLDRIRAEATTDPAVLMRRRSETLHAGRDRWWDPETPAKSAAQAMSRIRRMVEETLGPDPEADADVLLHVPLNPVAFVEMLQLYPTLKEHCSMHLDKSQGWVIASFAFARGNQRVMVRLTKFLGHGFQTPRDLQKACSATLNGLHVPSENCFAYGPEDVKAHHERCYEVDAALPGGEFELVSNMGDLEPYACEHEKAYWRPRRTELDLRTCLELYCPECLASTLGCISRAAVAPGNGFHLASEPKHAPKRWRTTQALWAMDPKLLDAHPKAPALDLSRLREVLLRPPAPALSQPTAATGRRRIRA